MPSRPTLRQVAAMAGVSLGTASLALSNKAGVAAETRAKVLEIASELGYQQQVRIPTPVTNSLSVIGMLLRRETREPLAVNPFYSYVLAGIEYECRRYGLSMMYAHIEVDEELRALAWPPMLLDQRVDGFIVVGTFIEDTIAQISQHAKKPIVLVDAYTKGQLFDSVVTDNIKGAYSAIEYLIDNGHSHIGLVGTSIHDYPSILERREGYKRAMRDNELPDELYIEEKRFPEEAEAGYAGTMRLLKRAPEITAIFTSNDEVAIGVVNAARELGLKVPKDLSVIGFDDIDLAQQVTPQITTVHVDKLLMGMMGVRHLRDLSENLNRSVLTSVVGTHLVIRDSVRTLE